MRIDLPFSLVALSVLIGLPACGGSTVHDPTGGDVSTEDLPFAVSGQRLEAWFLEMEGGGEGTALFSSFHDALLDVDCDFVPGTASGRYVCFPSARADVVYLDSACSQPVARVDAQVSGEPPGWMSAGPPHDGAPCAEAPLPSTIGYRRGERIFAGGLDALGTPQPTVFARVGATCQQTSLQPALLPESAYRLEAVGESTFVAGQAVPRRVAAELSVKRLLAEDGAQLTLGVLGGDGEPCDPQLDGLCVPTAFTAPRAGAGAGIYLDANCTETAFVPSGDGSCPVPKLGLERTGGTSHVYELAPALTFSNLEVVDPVTGERVLNPEGQVQFACQQDSRLTGFAPGAERTSELPRASRGELAINGLHWQKLRAPSATTGHAPYVPFEAGGVFLDEQGLGCRADAASGEFACHLLDSSDVSDVSLWRDSSCQQRLYTFIGSNGAAANAQSIATLRRVARPDAQTYELLSFKAYSGPSYEFENDQCVPAQATISLLDVDRRATLPRFTRVER